MANLAHLAAWLGRARPAARVSLIFPATPLGTMDAGPLAACFAARLHLARFPSATTGLGSVDAAALAALDDPPRRFADVFRAVARDERMRGHAMTDVQLAAHLRALADGPTPLVRLDGDEVAITRTGRAVRDGARDRLDAQRLDWWLGGVRLEGQRVRWRWDEAAQRIVAT